MNTSAFVITFIGTVASIVVILGNIFLIFSTRKRRKEIVLFYFRFHIDVLFGLSYFLYSFFILGFTIYGSSFFISNSDLFWLGLPFSNISAARTFIVLIIVMDRLLATYLPIKYHVARPRISNLLFYIPPFIFLIVEDFVIFIICGKNLKHIPDSCTTFPCTLNTCAYNWWTTYKSVIFPVIIFFTIILCIKLMLFSKTLQNSGVTKRANRLALLDAFLIFFFDFVPSFVAHEFPNSPLIAYTTTGPVTAMLKQVGRAIESIIVIEILVRRQSKIEDSRRSKRSTQPIPHIATISKP
ncbi:Serpentine Receptor, class BC (Class B-like) [Caenorhabditis elegans]|uniref:Serpentine Receptor, class BC (Class B-like) n=1 Tax=Caenorhabditis elegans TaxID=6239 RepID=O44636_CAEEL|nr:Serpentine Receptor, class BC (Class B-like) [Caenorhabditis elegans]CCD69575.1 Serpentine Receptor, class BC (Class B-like) [Caenorhabditis elegans]|eukprot:NP_503456.2 Serpentine Receptor, class BC (class B-like) [Caenorhabditis elegans]